METTRLTHSVDKLLLIVATTLTLSYYIALSSTILHTSKNEEGVIVQRNDSITTVIIPDKR